MRLKSILLLVLASTLVFAKHPKIARDLDNADPSAMVDAIIQFKTPPTAAHPQMIRDLGGWHRKSLDLAKGSLYSLAAGNSGRNNSAGTSGYATITAPGNDPCAITAGADCLDVWAALSSSDTANAGKSALFPTAQLDPKTHKVTRVLGANLAWRDSLVWVSRALHGFSIVWGS